MPAARVDALDREFHDDGHPEMTGAARTGRRSGDGGSRGRAGFLGALFRHPFRIAAVILLLVVLYLLNALFQPFHGDGHGHVAVRIPKGASVSEVGELLEKRGVISGPAIGPDASTLFQVRVTLAGKRSDLFAGNFNLKQDMSYGAAIDALSQEPKAQKPGVKTVTVPEGYTRSQAAQIIREDGVPGDYKKATVKSKYLNPAEYGGKGAKNLEGFLFPDTFELKPKAPVKDLVQLQLEDFKRKIKKVNMKYAKSKNLTVFDVVTIASMIEREAGVAKQRKLVASVIYNRLREGIPLGIDATIRFATGNYERPLTESELATESPYNTRLNQGLPPGPINSPGLAALQAAAHPAETEYIYYVNNPDSCNELTFAKTNAEFEAAVAKYEKAREANGGNAPSTCKE
ncbi:MAG: endolytic transglycosylase MltG [Actinobacteria bacterium]|nr:endolytic transglycosylase MltG [Actinomycetota bacterium]